MSPFEHALGAFLEDNASRGVLRGETSIGSGERAHASAVNDAGVSARAAGLRSLQRICVRYLGEGRWLEVHVDTRAARERRGRDARERRGKGRGRRSNRRVLGCPHRLRRIRMETTMRERGGLSVVALLVV